LKNLDSNKPPRAKIALTLFSGAPINLKHRFSRRGKPDAGDEEETLTVGFGVYSVHKEWPDKSILDSPRGDARGLECLSPPPYLTTRRAYAAERQVIELRDGKKKVVCQLEVQVQYVPDDQDFLTSLSETEPDPAQAAEPQEAMEAEGAVPFR
jgi:hypothetical protein